MDKVFVIGHKNPDTDSICAAIAYAELKQKQGVNAIAKRLGDLNRETEFVLKYFDVEMPEFLFTVKTQVSDLNMDKSHPITSDISIKTAWNVMRNNNIKTLPVVDDEEKLKGVVTLSDITNKYMDALDNNTIAASKTELSNIIDTLNAVVLNGGTEIFNTTGRVVVAASNENDIASYVEKGDIVISGNRKESLIKAIECGANLLIVTCATDIDLEVIDMAKSNNCILMNTNSDTFTTARLINQSIPIGYVMSREGLVVFNVNDFIDDIRDKMLKTRYRSYPVVDNKNRIKGFISRYHLISSRKKKVILVDHNEKSQTVNGIEQAEILEIVDHHRLADIQTGNPIFFKNEPVGSTSTIVANMFFDMGIRPARKIAGILCAAIISDTINFQSPTCTYTDKLIAEKLAEIAGLDIGQFAMKMFKEGSTLQGKTPEEIISTDIKEYVINKKKIGVAQVYSIDFESIQKMKESIIDTMKEYCEKNNYYFIMLMVTDILRQGSEILYAGEGKEIIERAFNVDVEGESIYMPGIVSRKKQVIPFITID